MTAVIETVALHTTNEARAMFVREADLSYDLGPAAARPYVDLAVLERALTESGADAVWPGWGFMAEDPSFVDLCDRLGVTFIGPSAEAMRRLGDKIGSKLLAEEVGVPIAPWSRGAVDTLESALASADEVGYPLMLKATAGGGGRGIRMVASAEDLADAFQRTSDEALRAFGNGTVFLERLVTGARHVEVQLIADGHGTAWALGVRDCSIQRRNQKVIEESASPLLLPEQAEEVKASAERLALAVGYVGAGTVEFLYNPGDRSFAFLEVNTRLQVEHSITEATTGVDLVKAQIFVADGGRLTDLYDAKPGESGHAVEARLNAEDPDRDFAPAPGRIVRLELPAGPGVRVDTGVAEGDTIPPDFDSMIAKIIAVGRTREEALARLRRAMRETTVVIEGGACNKSFVLDLLAQPEVVDGTGGWADTGWIDRVRAEGRLVAHAHAGVAIVASAIEAYIDEVELEVTRLLETAHGGRPQAQHKPGRTVEVKLRGTAYQVSTLNTGPSRYQVTVTGGGHTTTVEAELDRLDEFHLRLVVGGRRHHVVTSTYGPTTLVEVDGIAHRVTRDEGGVQRSPAPALVVATPVAVGDEVEAGAPVIVLESMKMETVLHAPFRARVKALLVTTGSQVETGTPLVRLEQVGDEDTAAEVALGRSADRAARKPPRTARRPSDSPGPAATSPRWCWASTYLPRPRTRPCRGTSRCGRRCGRRGSRCSRTSSSSSAPSPTSPSSVATSPPTRSATPSSACTARASTSTPTSRASTSSAVACRDTSASGWPRCCATTACWTSSAALSWRRRSSGSSSPSSGPRRRWRSPAPCSAAGSPSRCRPGTWLRTRAGCWNGSVVRPSCGSP